MKAIRSSMNIQRVGQMSSVLSEKGKSFNEKSSNSHVMNGEEYFYLMQASLDTRSHIGRHLINCNQYYVGNNLICDVYWKTFEH